MSPACRYPKLKKKIEERAKNYCAASIDGCDGEVPAPTFGRDATAVPLIAPVHISLLLMDIFGALDPWALAGSH
jgi:hypothetical protein